MIQRRGFIIFCMMALCAAGTWAQTHTPVNTAAPVQSTLITTSNSATAKPMVAPGKQIPNLDRVGGEDIATALPIPALPYYDTGDTCGFIDDYDEVCPFTGSTSPDVVYSFTPAADICVTIDLCTSEYDTKVYVYENAWTPGAPFACNDDGDCSLSYRSKIEQLFLAGGNTYYIVVDGYGGGCGVYYMDIFEVDCPVFCDATCPPGGIPEGEPICGDDYEDMFNGGCNSITPVFSHVSDGDVICGESGTYIFEGSDYRDTDWYEIGMGSAGTLSMTCCADFPLLMFIIQAAGPGDCSSYTILTSITAEANEEVTLSADVGNGWYWLWVGPSVFEAVPCGSQYTMTVDTGGVFPPTIDCGLAIVPTTGELPLHTSFSVTMSNLLPPPAGRPGGRVVAARIDLTTASGLYFPNWRGGHTNVPWMSSEVYDWGFTLPEFQQLLGDNLFHLAVEDVTYAPYNQPPYPPSGTTCMADVVVTAYEPCEGDTIDLAIPVDQLPYSATGDTCSCFDDYDEVCPYTGSTSPDVVYSFTPASDMCVTIDLCTSEYDTKVYVYENTWTPGAPYACNDDADCSLSYRSKIEQLFLAGGNTYYIVVDGFGGACGVYTMDLFEVDCPVFCDPGCPPGGIPEGEPPCGDEYEDVFNGGCNSVPPVFSDAAIGDVICGESGTFLFDGSSYRDTDWYLVTMVESGTLSMTCCADFPLLMFIMDVGSGDCVDYAVLNSISAEALSETYLEAFVSPGDYWLWVGPSVFDGVPCGAEYTFTIGFEPVVGSCEDDTVDLGPMMCGDVLNVTGDTTDATNWCGNASGDHFYQFEVQEEGLYTITTCGTFDDYYDTYLRLYDDTCCGNQIFYNDDGCVGGSSSLLSTMETTLAIGTYVIQVEGYSSNEGVYDLTVSCAVPPPE